MAKKKARKSAGGSPKRPRKPKASRPASSEMEGLLRELAAAFLDEPVAETPLDRAYEILGRIDEDASPARQEQVAREALAACPDCADAYLALAGLAGTRSQELELIEQAVAAAERSLGPEIFEHGVGDFWLMVETRPYMRARATLAHFLWNAGRRAEAADHLQDLLRLNPNDNQGHRYILASWLASLERDEELGTLLGRYQESSAMWGYSQALHAFRTQGDTPAARKLLKAARKLNKFVPGYLTTEVPLPRELPPYYGFGDDDEAIIYAAEALSAWRDTPGAITWVRETLKSPRKRAAKAAALPSDETTAPDLERLRRLPRAPDSWVAGFASLPSWIEVDGERMHPWASIVASRDDEAILNLEVSEAEPATGRLWSLLAKAMTEPNVGSPRLPASIEIASDERWGDLATHLEALGIDLVRSESIDELDMLLAHLGEFLAREQPPAMLDIPGVSPEIVSDYFAAAAAYRRAAPWKRSSKDQMIEVKCAAFESGPWYAVVMGESGITQGLALYENLKQLRKLLSGKLSDEEGARRTVALATTFDPIPDAHPGDLEAARLHGWEITDPEGFPTIYRKELGMTTRPPLAWELRLMAGCLRALPEYLATSPKVSRKSTRIEVASSPEPLTFDLRLLE